MRRTIILISILLIASAALAQQAPALKLPRPSPKASVMQTVGLTDITVQYSRPGVKGRQIWGALVPYDKVWRAGANEATTIQFSDEVVIGGTKLPAGLYSIHTIPGKDEWTVIFNSVAEQWGSYSYDAAKDVVRVKVKPEKADFREWMSFEFADLTTDAGKLVLRWENVAVPVTITTNSTAKAFANIRSALAAAKPDDWNIAYRAAGFAFENNAMNDAETWLAQSLKAKETMAGLWLKARMLQKAGKKADAIATAEKALTLATANDANFASEIRKNVDIWKKS